MYGEGRNWRFIIGFGLLAALLIVVILLIVRSGGDSGKVPETKRALTSYANDPNITVSETIIGPINAPQNHNEATISVSNQTATMQLMQGYDGNVINSHDYNMSPASFSEFLHALDKAGFTLGNNDKALKNDAGYCSEGQRYIFEVKDGSNTVQRYWTTSCKGAKTYRGSIGLTLDLFRAQIPDYDSLTDNTTLGSNSFGI